MVFYAAGQEDEIFAEFTWYCVTGKLEISSKTMILDNDLFPLVFILGPITQLKFSENNSNCKIAHCQSLNHSPSLT